MTGTTVPPTQQPGQAAPPPASQQQQQGLPPTGLQQQLNSLNNLYSQTQNAGVGQGLGGIGYNVRKQQFDAAQQQGGGELGDVAAPVANSNLDSIARNLAQRYGMPIGKGRLVDDNGNFLYTPEQLAEASGGSMTLGEAAANMNYISQALTDVRNEKQQKKGLATLQSGLAQINSRGRGSMAALTSGYYQDIANLQANQEYEARDFSYYIQKEQQDIAMELQRRVEKAQKKQAQGQFWTGIGTTIVGLYTGNVALIGAGAAQIGGSAGQTGYF